MATVAYNLGGVALPYAIFSWPKYRGTIAEVIPLDCPAQNYTALETLAKSLGGNGTYLEVTGPDKAGNNPGTVTLRIEGVQILRVVKLNAQLCRVYIADKRQILTRRVGDMDFQLRFGDGYLEGTEAGTYQAAVRKLVASVDVLRGNVEGSAYISFPPAVKTHDGYNLAGLMLPQELGVLLDDAGADMAVTNGGQFRFPGRKDIDDDAALPSKTAYSWHVEPGWISDKSITLGKPRKVRSYYWERHCLRMIGGDPSATISTSGPVELQVQLEQVYASDGQYFTLSELLDHWGFRATDLTDAMIAKAFMTDRFQGSPFAVYFGTVEFSEVFKAVRDGWRTLWRIKFVDDKGHVGGWTDWAAGKIKADGALDPVAVECPWVDFMGSISPSEQGKTGWLDSDSTKNHADDAPFTVTWDGDPSNGIVRLVQNAATPSGGFAVPGALVKNLGVRRISNIEDGEGASFTVKGIPTLIEREDVSKAEFKASFEVKVYLCATRRMPNNETRWHREDADTKYADADIEYVELPPSGELLCYRDYVSAEAGHAAINDGLGPVLNAIELKDDAERRMEDWKITHGAPVGGFGVAESIMLFRDFEVDGAVSRIVLESTLEGNGCTLRTRIETGNLADSKARARRVEKRLANREVKERGVKANA